MPMGLFAAVVATVAELVVLDPEAVRTVPCRSGREANDAVRWRRARRSDQGGHKAVQRVGSDIVVRGDPRALGGGLQD